MLSWLGAAIRQILPLPLLQSDEGYVEFYSKRVRFKSVAALEEAADRATLKNLNQLLEHALRYQAEEQERSSSIVSRAQALLVAQTFFGALLAFSTAIIGRIELFSGWRLPALILVIGYTLSLVVLLTINALRATAGLPYRRMGTSDLAEWIPQSEKSLVKSVALGTLANYRHAGIVNTWRSTHLDLAQQCLRNIVFVLALLVILVVATIAVGSWTSSWPTTLTDPIPFIFERWPIGILNGTPASNIP